MDNNQNNNTMVNTNSPVMPQDPASATAWQLVGMSPSLSDLTIDIGTSLSIGRSDTNDVILAAPQISRQHARINRIGDKIYVQDLSSSNGTFVNNQRIDTQAVQLNATDELAFADLVFLVTSDQLEELDADNFLQNLAETQSSSNLLSQKSEMTPTILEPSTVIDVVTTQDFVASNAEQAPVVDTESSTDTITSTDSNVVTPEIKEVNIDEIAIKTTQPSLDAQQNTTQATHLVAEPVVQPNTINDTVVKALPTATIQAATNSPITPTSNQTNTTPPTMPAKKNGLLAIIIIIAIVAIIIGSLFLK